MMKKMLNALFVALLTMAYATPAFAADNSVDQDSNPQQQNTDITFEVTPTYMVSIPTDITLEKTADDSGTITYKKEAVISAENVRLEVGKQLSVTMDAGDYKLTDQTHSNNTLAYTVKVGDTSIADKITPLAQFQTSTVKQDSNTITFSANDPTYAGTYKDTVIFTVGDSDL